MSTNGFFKHNPVDITMRSFAAVAQKEDRIFTGDAKVTVQFVPARAGLAANAGWAHGKSIEFNQSLLRGQFTSAIANRATGNDRPWTRLVLALKGLNYHELAHLLYTEGPSHPSRHEVILGSKAVRQAWNMLEDQRIELLFWSRYLPTEPFFTYMVMEWVMGNVNKGTTYWDLATSYPWIAQRKYLPRKFRSKLRAAFVNKMDQAIDDGSFTAPAYLTLVDGESVAAAVDQIVLDFLPVGATAEGPAVVRRMADLLDAIFNAVDETLDDKPIDSTHDASIEDAISPATQQEIEDLIDQIEEVDYEDYEAETMGQSDPDDSDEEGDADATGETDSDATDEEEADDGDGEEADGSGKSTVKSEDQDPDAEDTETGAGGGDDDPAEDDPDLHSVSDDVDEIEDETLNDVEVQEDVRQTTDSIQSVIENHEFGITTQRAAYTATRRAGVKAIASNDRMVEAVKELRTGLEEHWEGEQRYGKLNPKAAMRRQATHGSFDVFDQWQHGAEAEGEVECVVLLDASISMAMASLEGPSQVAAWQIKRMFDEVDMPCTVLTYGNKVHLLYNNDEQADPFVPRRVPANHSHTKLVEPLTEAAQVLEASKMTHKLIVIVTDGEWYDDDAADEMIGKFNEVVNTTTALVRLGGDAHGDHNCKITADYADPMNMVGFVESIVVDITKNALRNR